MKRLRIIMSGATGCLLLYAASPGMALAAASNDPDWPCIQRKVPELSIDQVWNGPEIPETAGNWNADPKIEDLVGELAARRNPLDAAQKQVVEFATCSKRSIVSANRLFLVFRVTQPSSGSSQRICARRPLQWMQCAPKPMPIRTSWRDLTRD